MIDTAAVDQIIDEFPEDSNLLNDSHDPLRSHFQGRSASFQMTPA